MIDSCCALLGENRVVAAKIALTEHVATLKEIIREKLQLQCPADKLELSRMENLTQSADDGAFYLTHHGELHSLKTLLFQVYFHQAQLMTPAHLLSTYLRNASTDPGTIHVVVGEPFHFGGDKDIDGFAAELTKIREIIAFGDITVEKCKLLASELQFAVVVKKIRKKDRSTGLIPAFEWTSEADQSQRWMAYLRDHLGKSMSARGFALEAGSDLPELLSIADDQLPFGVRGEADAVIVKGVGKFTRQFLHHLAGLRVVIDVRQDLETEFPKYEPEAIAKLIATSLLCPNSFVGLLLTNLTNMWTFLWIDEHRQVKTITVTQPANAVALVLRLLTKKDNGSNFHILFAGNCRRRKLSEMIAETRASSTSCKVVLSPRKRARAEDAD